MYFVIIAAFAILLSDGLPPPEWNVLDQFAARLGWAHDGAHGTLTISLLQIPITALVALVVSRRTLRARDGTPAGDARSEDRYANGGLVLAAVLLAGLIVTLLFSGWLGVVRREWGLARWPLVGDLVALAPFMAAVLASWIFLYPAECAVRSVALSYQAARTGVAPHTWKLPTYLAYKFRHQILIVVAPMCLVLVAKYVVGRFEPQLRHALPRMPWAGDALVGLSAALVLIISPVLLRYLWVTRPLPDGPLRQRLEELCNRIGPRHREILVWESQGLMVNAAVMGLFSPVRYILLSDGLLSTMSERQIEAVFGHEAGHVRRHHLVYFGIFAILSMLVVGGLIELLDHVFRLGNAPLQVVGLGGMLAFWGLAFGFVSRKFERQADLFGAVCVTPGAADCEDPCKVHPATIAGSPAGYAPPIAIPNTAETSGLVCSTAAPLFGRTLINVAQFNGIPLEARSWRHGSIQSRCDLLFQFASEPEAVRRFEQSVWIIKAAMVTLTLIGCAVAVKLYWPF